MGLTALSFENFCRVWVMLRRSLFLPTPLSPPTSLVDFYNASTELLSKAVGLTSFQNCLVLVDNPNKESQVLTEVQRISEIAPEKLLDLLKIAMLDGYHESQPGFDNLHLERTAGGGQLGSGGHGQAGQPGPDRSSQDDSLFDYVLMAEEFKMSYSSSESPKALSPTGDVLEKGRKTLAELAPLRRYMAAKKAAALGVDVSKVPGNVAIFFCLWLVWLVWLVDYWLVDWLAAYFFVFFLPLLILLLIFFSFFFYSSLRAN